MGWNWQGGLQGAGGGAMMGASVGGPLGGLIGGAAGGLLGMFGDRGNPYQGRMDAFMGQQAPQMGPAAQGAYSDFRGSQQDLVNMLQAQARGQGPSLAQQQLEAATDRNSRAAQSLASGAQGPNAAMAQFQAQTTMGNLGAQAAQDAAAARIQEIYNAQNQLGLVLHGARGADEDMNRFNAGQQNMVAGANLDAELAKLGMNRDVLMQMYGSQQGPGMGAQILAGGAGALSFLAGQRGNQPQQQGGGGYDYFAQGQGMQPGYGNGQGFYNPNITPLT